LPRCTPKSVSWLRAHPIHRPLKSGEEFALSTQRDCRTRSNRMVMLAHAFCLKRPAGLRPTQPGAGALESVVRWFETMPSNIGTFHRAGRSAQPSRGLAGGYQTGKQQVHIMITATSHPGFTLISNPNFDAAAPHDQSGSGIGRSDLRIIGKLPSTVQGSTKMMERQEDAAEFRGATWTDPAWEMRHRPDNGQP
jgi:hypothetical protein